MASTLDNVADLQKLGERLLLARRRKGLSQGDLSKLAPCDLSLISRIERGVKPSLSVEVLCRLARALDTSPNDLLGWEQVDEDAPPAQPTTRPRTRQAAPVMGVCADVP